MMKQTKKLNRVLLINWMYFQYEIININQGSALLTGENAAGKSTILDAMQMVLTGNTKKFNRAANENSDRDLRSYVRCKIDTIDQKYLRNKNVISNVALEFYEEKEDRWFVIGVHLTSPNETEEVTKRWYISNGRIEDFSFIVDGNKPAMHSEFRRNGEPLRYYNRIGAYKDDLRLRLGNLEEKFFEVLLKALAFRPVDNVKDFINRYVLSEKVIDVDSLRESLNNLKDLEKTLEIAKNERDKLEEIKKRFSDIEKNNEDLEINETLLKIIECNLVKETIDNYKIAIKQNKQKLNKNEREQDDTKKRLDDISQRLNDLKLQMEKTEFVQLTAKINNKIAELKEELKDEERNEQELQKYVASLKEAFKAFLKLKDIPVSRDELNYLLDDTDKDEKIEIIEKCENYINGEIESIINERVKSQFDKDQKAEESSKLDKEITQLENQNIQYPRETEELRNAILEEFKRQEISSSVYILSELLTIEDKVWTNAIEGYLNTQRFYLVVEPKYYDTALEIYSANKKSHSQGIINFKKLPEKNNVEANSLANCVKTENRYARRYIDYILGNVICCDNLSELENYNQSITKDCMVYKNYVSRKINPAIYLKPYIGKDAIKIQLENAKNERQKLQKKIKELREKIDIYLEIEEKERCVNIDMIKNTMYAPNALVGIREQIADNEDTLSKIEKNADIIELENQISKADEKRIELSDKKDKLIGENVSLKKDNEQMTEQLNYFENEIKEKDKEIKDLQDYKIDYYNAALKKYDVASRDKSNEQLKANYTDRNTGYKNRQNRLLNGDKDTVGLIQLQSDYNAKFDRDFHSGMEGMEEFNNQFLKLDSVDIVKHEETVRKAQDNCEDIFRNEFISQMKESIESASYEFDNLRSALKDINYGEDTYKFTMRPNPQKENFYKMIMSEDNMGQDGGLFTGLFENRYKDEIDELFSKLKASDSSDKVVKEYTDYRYYLDYDIEIHKKNGTIQRLSSKAKSNSGGESQVPFYVIMAASLNNLYKSNNSIRLFLLDEAFNNMDEQRISSIMEFFKKLNFQTILCVPSPKMQDIEGNVDTVITINRKDTLSYVQDFKYNGD